MVNWRREDLARIFSALVLPVDESERLDRGALRALVEMELADGVEGFYCCGSSGEGLLMSLEERMRVVEDVMNTVNGRVSVVAHVGTVRTQDVITLARHAREVGCTAISMIPPYYYHFSLEEITGYYEAVARAVPDMPIILYNIPQFTGVEFTKENAARLMENPNIIGIKHTSHNLYALERLSMAYPDKCYLNGFDEMFLGALAMGAEGTISTTTNLFAPLFLRIREAFRAGDMARAQRLQHQLNARVETLVKHGIFAATKYGCTLRGVPCGACRAPFAPLSEAGKEAVRRLLAEPIDFC